ncbi:hypothetical protein [Massilia sp. PWRC2]|uniref:hypothetical protein n=1 Tax=Massilia sp. PWRC2 TaxID=2804626 RepID=UPI003CF5B15F
MKILALMMGLAALVFFWAAFSVFFLKQRRCLLKLSISPVVDDRRVGAFAAYYIACAMAALYVAALFYHENVSHFISIPAICGCLVLWRRLLLRRA